MFLYANIAVLSATPLNANTSTHIAGVERALAAQLDAVEPMSKTLRLPSTDFPVSSYTVAAFCDIVVETTEPEDQFAVLSLSVPRCPEGHAAISSIEVHKANSWFHFRHEFLVLHFTYPLGERGLDYVVHLDRAWDATPGWREYFPLPTWGSIKPSFDEIRIYVSGQDEITARGGTEAVARLQLQPASLKLQHLAQILRRLLMSSPWYSLVGVNCWAWSRAIMKIVVQNWTDVIDSAELMGPSGTLDEVPRREVVEHFHGGLWSNIGFLGQGQTEQLRTGQGSYSCWTAFGQALIIRFSSQVVLL